MILLGKKTTNTATCVTQKTADCLLLVIEHFISNKSFDNLI